MGIQGIPYFGIDSDLVWRDSVEKEIAEIRKYKSLLEMIRAEIEDKDDGNDKVVVINSEWLSFLRDVRFNYRDKECYLPYYTFELAFDIKYKGTNSGHLIKNCDRTVTARHSYDMKKVTLGKTGELVIFNVGTEKKYKVTWDRYTDKCVDIDELHSLYIDSSYKEEDLWLNGHTGGYHYITKEIKGFRNSEKIIRDMMELEHYSDSYRNIDTDYRDVRAFKEEMLLSVGMCGKLSYDPYWLRKLRFESEIYCIMREQATDSDRVLAKFYSNNDKILKIGDRCPLILKKYWLDGKEVLCKSWIHWK